MDSFEINKLIAAILLTVLIVIGIGKFADLLFYIEKPKQSAYKIEGLDSSGSQTKLKASVKEEIKVDINQLLALGNLAHGEKVFKKCSACHMIEAVEKI